MDARQLLTDIYTSTELCRFSIKGKSKEDTEDIVQLTFLRLFEKPEALIIDLNERGKLKGYVIKMLSMMANLSQSEYNRANRVSTRSREFKDNTPVSSEEWDLGRAEQELIQRLWDSKEQLNWFDKAIVDAHLELGSCRKVAKATGISPRSVMYHFDKIKSKIKENAKLSNQ